MDIYVSEVQGCNADASESTPTLASLVLLVSPLCACQFPNTMICFCIAKGPLWCPCQDGACCNGLKCLSLSSLTSHQEQWCLSTSATMIRCC